MFSLQDLLDLPLIRSARPEVMAGEEFATRRVRWVHTSEIFEISPLLKGEEVLFTTGLGLVGAPAGAIAEYVASLARQNVTALVMEIGRTFVHLPEEFVLAAQEHALPLIVLRRVVPFVEITETVHPLLIEPEVAGLRHADAVYRHLSAVLLGGADLPQLVAEVAGLLDRPVGLYSAGGQLLAGSDLKESAGDDRVDVPVGPDGWAVLTVGADPGRQVSAALTAAAALVGVRIAQQAPESPSRALAVADLVADMIGGRFLDPDEVQGRAAALGFGLNPRRPAVALVCDLTRSARARTTAVTRAARRRFGANLVAEVDDAIVVVTHLRGDRPVGEQVAAFIDEVDEELRQAAADGVSAPRTGRVVRVVAGPLADSMTSIVASTQRAVHGARLARRLGIPERVLTDRDLGLHDLLTRVVPDIELEAFVEQQLGPLLQTDARSGHQLVATLDAYLAAGRSKSVAAGMLGIRRQTMYQRLERISALLGGVDLAAPGRLTALDLAVTAWRMRTSGLTGLREPSG